MRTTLSIDDEALELARELAKRRGVSLGQAVSELVLRGARRELLVTERRGFAVAELSADSSPVTTEDVRRMLDDFP